MSVEEPMDTSGQNSEKKIELPSSGLAEDILSKVDFSGITGAVTPDGLDEDFYAESADKEEAEETLHLVGFFLNREEYALDISQVQEIIRVTGWTRVPNAPGYIKGVINLRGKIIPVVDPKVRMNSGQGELTKDSRIIVVEAGKKTIGMLVDSVSQVLRIPLSTVESAPDEVAETDQGFVKGVGKMGRRLILLLDLARVLGRA